MTNDEAWPPKSAYDALISSPNGRRKAADYGHMQHRSPSKVLTATPSLLDRLRLARRNEDHIQVNQIAAEGEDDEDDEEILQLKLAAIEAKLKLKKLQKGRKDETVSLSSGSMATTNELSKPTTLSEVQVLLSPSKRQQTRAEQRSPNRVLLGIDKGRRATDVSLRKARTATSMPLNENHANNRLVGRSMSTRKPGSSARSESTAVEHIKSFSDRMAESRENDKKIADKRDMAQKARTQAFQIDREEFSKYKQMASSRVQSKTGSPTRQTESRPKALVEPNLSEICDAIDRTSEAPSTDHLEEFQGDATLFEGFSGLHLSSRILPQSFLKRTIPKDRFTIYTIPDLLKNVTSPAYEVPDEVGDFVVFGVVASKSQPLDQKIKADDNTKSSDAWQKKWEDGSSNRKKFMAFTITDLTWTIDLYLFDTALPRYHRINIGTVVAILNPSIMPPKRGREDTGAFSLALHNGDDTILEIGTSQHLGSCKATRKDGQQCGSWVDNSKTEICEFHLNLEIAKTQAMRMGVNSGSNGLGGYGRNKSTHRYATGADSGGNRRRRGLLPAQQGRGFDRETGSHYYVTASTRPSQGNNNNTSRQSLRVPRSNLSAANMLDLDIDDPFIAEGQLSRDREARLQKRLASQEQERRIAKRLSKLVDSGGGAGAEYMKRRTETSDHQYQTQNPDSKTITGIPDLKSIVGHKRPAQEVHLSPVSKKQKKTRFLTSSGIKDVGRDESIIRTVTTGHKEKKFGIDGSNGGGGGDKNMKCNDNDDDDDDDDLDII